MGNRRLVMADARERAWRDVIVDHSQFPRRHGRLEHASHEGEGENPFCGDRVKLQLLLDDRGKITDVRFEATGCAISMASASILASHLVSNNARGAEELFRKVHTLLTGEPGAVSDLDEELEALQLVRRYPARVKCATLAWHVMRNALGGIHGVATTE